AKARYEQSLGVAERLARDNPGSAEAQRSLSISYDRLGDVLREGGDLAGARARYEQYLEITERLARDNPGSAKAQRDLIVSYVKMQESLGDAGYAQRALELASKLQVEGRLSPSDAGMIPELRRRAGEAEGAGGGAG
ncbi:MAG: tetratricopeptide repeat-containing protein, partial [Alphaproteobacteria bacterium]|nr:tetratricopeptide repeat-containing protein [Alphaproteobacteria bacterium]